MKTDSGNNFRDSGNPGTGNGNTSMEGLIEQLKTRDARQKQTYRRFKIIMWVCVVFYAALLVINPDPYLTLEKRISGLCYVVAFLTGAYLFRKEQKAMAQISYSEPILKVMKSAAERYRPFKKGFYAFLLVPLFINLGITISGSTDYMPDAWSDLKKMVVLQTVYWSIMLISAIISYFVWTKRSKPYRDAVNELIGELES